MTPTEATALATRILRTFNGPPLADWEEELGELDAGRAGTAYVRIRREHLTKWLSIAEFAAVYRSLHTDDASTRPPACGWCDNTGWTQTPDHVQRAAVYSGVKPCTRCPEGRAREVSETWTKSPLRQFITDAEAERLIAATRARHPSNSKGP